MNPASNLRVTGGFSFVLLCVAGVCSAYLSLVRQSPIPAIALVYCSAFMFLVWTRPQIALIGIIGVTPFVQDLGGGLPVKFSLAEIHLLLAFVVYITKGVLTRSLRLLGPLTIPVVVYLAVLTWTSLRTGLEQDDIRALIQTLVTCGVTVAVFANMTLNVESMLKSMIWLPLVCLPLAIMGIATGNSYVFGLHKNSVGGTLAVAVIVTINLWYSKNNLKYQRYMPWLIVVLTSGLLISLSRGAWIGTMAGLAVSGVMWGRVRLVIRSLVLLMPVLLLLWALLPSEKREYATGFQADRWNIRMRLKTQNELQDIIKSEPLFGVGIGLRKQVDATNFVLVTLAESGFIGLFAVTYVFGAVVSVAIKVRRCTPVGDNNLVVAISLGVLACKLGHGMVDHFWGRGNGTVVWATIGMLIAAERTVTLSQKHGYVFGKPRVRTIR